MPQLVAEVTIEEDAAGAFEEVAGAAGAAVSREVAGLVTVDEAGEAASIEFDWDAAAAGVPDDAGAAALVEVEPWAPVGAVAEAPLSPPPPPHALNAATKNKRDAWTILFKMLTPA
jgi:hypothetical protein